MRTMFAAAVLIASSACAATFAADTLSGKDRAFLEHDAQGTSYEMQLSQMAEQKSSDPAIKAFARQDIADHQALNTTAEQIAQSSGMTLPKVPTAEKQQDLIRLSALSGQSFDAAYLKAMKSINADDKSDFAREAGETSNAQVKQFVETARETDRKHEQIVDKLSAKS